jgi:HK97 family phage prohead protease
VSDVRHPERTVELLAVPYNQWADVVVNDRLVKERFAPGAFGNVQNRTDRIAVLAEHDPARRIGRVAKLSPNDPAGLRAELRISRGPEGDQALDDAADGMVDGSVGFGCLPENMTWEGNNRRTINKAFLDHIALVWAPAYQGAKVLAVRSTRPPEAGDVPPVERTATPLLDAILLERLATSYHLDQ